MNSSAFIDLGSYISIYFLSKSKSYVGKGHALSAANRIRFAGNGAFFVCLPWQAHRKGHALSLRGVATNCPTNRDLAVWPLKLMTLPSGGREQLRRHIVLGLTTYYGILEDKPPYSPPYIHKTAKGQRVSFQTWTWEGDNYRLIQYIVDDEDTLQVSKFECEYRATRRAEITDLLLAGGCSEVKWLFPEETDFYQQMCIA